MKFTHEKRLSQNKLHLILVNCFETVSLLQFEEDGRIRAGSHRIKLACK